VVIASKEKNSSEISESQIAAILEHRYGDGMARFPRKQLDQLIALAKKHGFIDAGDYLTRKGRALIARYH
jgi:hypothetical protein